jgi:hypothetical protein
MRSTRSSQPTGVTLGAIANTIREFQRFFCGISMTPNTAAAWPIMVLAYNEEGHITKCLDSIFTADPGCRFEVFVMAERFGRR